MFVYTHKNIFFAPTLSLTSLCLCPQKYPPRKDLVRAVSIQTGYLIQSTGPKSCVITYLAQVDPKGEGLALAAYHGILPYTTGVGPDLLGIQKGIC